MLYETQIPLFYLSFYTYTIYNIQYTIYILYSTYGNFKKFVKQIFLKICNQEKFVAN